MGKLNFIILIAVIGIAVIFSGCAGNPEKTLAETPSPTPAQTNVVETTVSQTSAPNAPVAPYQVQVTEIRKLEDCIISSISTEIKPCTLINLEIKNNNVNSLNFKLVKEEIIAKSTKVLPKRYDKEVGLNDLCTRQAGMEFILDEKSNRNIGLCHPIVDHSEEPVLNIEALINGERKNYVFSMPS